MSAEPKPLNRSNCVGPLRYSIRVNAETGTIEAWDWSPDGNILAYFAGDRLWLKAGNQPAASVAAFTKQGGRGGGEEQVR